MEERENKTETMGYKYEEMEVEYKCLQNRLFSSNAFPLVGIGEIYKELPDCWEGEGEGLKEEREAYDNKQQYDSNGSSI